MLLKLKRAIPNLITLLNLLCGTAAVTVVYTGFFGREAGLIVGIILIFAGAFFDFWDGLTARALRVQSPLGVQLDSLADLITFGFAPASLYVAILWRNVGAEVVLGGDYPVVVLTPLLMVAFAAYRLGKFNVDTRQTTFFLGLPSPASALFTCGVVAGMVLTPQGIPFRWLNGHLWMVVVLALVQGGLMVTEIPMFSLKIKHFSLPALIPHILLLAVAIPSVIVYRLGGLLHTMVAYVLLSLIFKGRFARGDGEGTAV
ncbi:MAG: CDP-alcohol phosphatidyltransferase family protein [Bacteroides sp.]|jgi:CDP-diacylglycerol-serine O-phosphatidyltransferase